MPVPIAAEVNARLQKRENTHPGLLLDKYVESWTGGVGNFSELVQKPTVTLVAEMSAAPPAGVNWADLFTRHAAFLAAAHATAWEMDTDGPLVPHLSRASALENAGLCLHRVYGFAYLPGTGLNGMARSYAETVAKADPNLVRQVFGHLKEKGDDTGSAGAVVFHDAWPTKWPRLTADLLNSHHGKYYQGQRDEAPGDWDEPNMVSFLAVAPGQRFCFAVAPRRGDVDPKLVALAKEWLTHALIEEGAGAKTAAGYGGFKPVGAPVPEPRESPNRRRYRATLELVSPAFLAGANQNDRTDCDLRPATLRGLLRWWWRTMHSGFVDVPTLRAMEAAVWGSTGGGGPVRATVSPVGGRATPVPLDRQQVIRDNRLPAPPNNQTTQGLTYLSYGMDEVRQGTRRQRAYLAPGARWTVNLTARPGRFAENKKDASVRPITPELLLDQAKAALWLLCQYGGVGSKSRNGFGSFADLPGLTLEQVKAQAKAFRVACGVDRPFNKVFAQSLALEEVIRPLEVPTQWRNEWYAADQIGAAMQAFAQTLAHNPRKLALGLPRQIHGPRPEPLPHQRGRRHDRPLRLRGPKGERHAAPVFYHLSRPSPADPYTVRVTAMVARSLPNEADSRAVLTDLMTFLAGDLPARAGGGGGPSRPPAPGIPRPVAAAGLPQANARVECVLLAEKTKKGGWRAKWTGSVELVGPITNTADVPADKKADDSVTLVVAAINPITKEISFRWPK